MDQHIFLKTNSNLQSVLEFSLDSIMVCDSKGKIVYWNPASEKLFGYTKQEAFGKDLTIIIPNEMHDMHTNGMNRFMATRKGKLIGNTIEVNAKKKDQSIFPVELSLFHWEEGESAFVCGFIRDITTRTNRDHELVDLRSIIDSSPSCVKLVDSVGNLKRMNPVGLYLIGAESLEQVYDACVYDIVHEDDRERFKEFNEMICKGGSGTLIFKIVSLTGTERIMETFARPHEMSNGQIGHLAITNDISERVKADEKLRIKDEELEEARRLSVVGEFAAGIAHEVNNPLAVLKAKTQLLELQIKSLDIDAEDKVKELFKSMEIINETVNHTADLIKNLKTFSTKDTFGTLEFSSLSEIIDVALNISKSRCSYAGIELEIDVDEKIEVECSPVSLSQVILNLILNSIHAIETLDNKWISIKTKTSKKGLQILVTDCGSGIPDDIAGKIMHPFFTTKEPGKGTGIGLSLSRKAVAKMNGHLYYNTNSPNTQFIIEFEKYR